MAETSPNMPEWGEGRVVIRDGKFYINSPYGASAISPQQARQIALDYYKKQGGVAFPGVGGGASGGRAAKRTLQRGLGEIKTRRAAAGIKYGEQKRSIRRTGKGAIAQTQGYAAEQGGGRMRGGIGQMPVEYLSRTMGRQLSTADIAQAQAIGGLRAEEGDLRLQYQKTLADQARRRAQAIEAQAKADIQNLLASGMTIEDIQRWSQGG